MSDEHRWRRKCFVICLLALFIGLMGIVLPEQEDIAFEVIVNNTNLAPTQSGIIGTGERINDTDYYANNSAIQLLVYSNSSVTGIADISIFINDTAVQNYDSSSAMINQSAALIIPKYSKYKVIFTNYHHYEWREYPILSGRNGTLSINQSFINNDIAIEYVVNNTDLYNNGRVQDVVYTANDSAIQLFLIFHALGTGSPIVIDTNLSINGTVVEDRDYRTSAGAGLHEHFSMTAHIPKGANYSVTNSSNLETIEWREYPILTGRNGTLSINITQGGGTGSQNLSQVLNQGNTTNGQTINFTNSGKWLNVGYNSASGLLEVTTNNIFYYKQGTTFLGFTGSGFAYSAYDNRPMKFGESGSNYSQITHNATYGTVWYGNDTGGANGNLNITGFDQVNMYQTLDLNNQNVTNISYINNVVTMNQTTHTMHQNVPRIWINDSGTDISSTVNTNSDLFNMLFTSNHPNQINNLISFRAINNTGFPFFLGQRARGNISNGVAYPLGLQKNDFMFRLSTSGWAKNATIWSGSRGGIDFFAQDEWNSTSTPVYIEIFTTQIGSTTAQTRLRVFGNGSIQIVNFAGSSKTYLCQENGFITAGTPGC